MTTTCHRSGDFVVESVMDQDLQTDIREALLLLDSETSTPTQVKIQEPIRVTFKIKYETKPGQSLCIVGSIPQLGEWSDYKAQMSWTDDHVWVLEDFPLDVAYFQYKYVVMQDG